MATQIWDKVKSKIIYSDVAARTQTLEHLTQPVTVAESTIKFVNDIETLHTSPCFGPDLLNDVEMFTSYEGITSTNTVFSTFDLALQGSKTVLRKLLEYPSSNIDILLQRIKWFKSQESRVSDPSVDPEKTFQRLAELEPEVLWLLTERDEHLKDLFDILYFKWYFLDKLNDSPELLSGAIFYKIALSPLIGIMTPILYFLVPYLVMRFLFDDFGVSFVTYLRFTMQQLWAQENIFGSSILKWIQRISYIFSLVFYFQGAFNSVELSQTFYKISKHLVDKINNLLEFANLARAQISILWTPEVGTLFFKMPDAPDFEPPMDPKPFSIFTNFGKQLQIFKRLNLEAIRNMIRKVYVMDALYCICRYRQKMDCCYVEYLDPSGPPRIEAQGIWHPSIPKERVVRNDIMISNNKNAIITGPNAGGKSTFIKSALINSILAQTVGIALAITFKVTVFDKIHSQVQIPDHKGQESLFEAEMYRCKRVLDMISTRRTDKVFVVMDEIFNSTNPVEGIAGSYAIVKKITEYPNSLLAFTTHYTYLSKLQKDCGRFVNLKMNVVKNGDEISYPYRIEEGVSKQYIALDLLKKNGFDADIIDEALRVKAKFVVR